MTIGIVGAGEIGGALAVQLVRNGHDIVIANSRGPETLEKLIAPLGPGAKAGTVADAAQAGEVVFLAIPFNRYPELPAEPFTGRIVVDAGNYDIYRDGRYPQLDRGETTSGQMLAEILPGARIVKAFNTIWYRRLRDEGRPDRPAAERLAIPVAGDDPEAKAAVFALAEQFGFAPVDTGTLAESRRQEYGTPVFNKPVGPADAEALLRLVP
ncbi:NADPH-dependent F420 reductase [Saccharothrix hoggarensis]|uniref:NADPH-dependent F420 reductase n=1 Tax=Saccharothrix hoggarensis TaxID=913853 RepID=A0ABW3R3K8_9PSEU